jgi:hypothetical protein
MTAVSDSEEPPEAPATGVPAIDEALAGLDLCGDVGEHPEQFTRVVEALQAALRDPDSR